MSSDSNKKLGSILRLLVSFAFLGGLIFILRDELPQVLSAVRNADANYLVLVLGIFFTLYFFFSVLRLKLIFIVQHVKLSFLYIYFLRFIGFFFNNFLPSAVGGDLMSAYLASKRTGKGIECFTAVFIDRLLGFFTTFLLALTALLLEQRHIPIPYFKPILIVATALFVLLPFFLFSRRIARPFRILVSWLPHKIVENLTAAYHAVYQYRHHPVALVNIVLVSLVFQVSAILINYLSALALGIEMTLWDSFILVPLVWVVSMIPSLGGLGVREGAYVLFFGKFSGNDKAFALGLLYFALTILASVIGGICYLFAGRVSSEELEKMKEEDMKKLEEEPLV